MPVSASTGRAGGVLERLRPGGYEAAVCAGLAVVVFAVVLSTAMGVRRWRVQKRTVELLAEITRACRRLHTEYNGWPAALQQNPGDAQFGERMHNRDLINILVARDGPGNPGHSANPARIVFLPDMPRFERGKGGLDETYDLLDPWGTPVRVVLDTDGDGFCRAASGEIEPVPDVETAAWSAGPDRIFGTADDIRSWNTRRPHR